MPYKRKKYHSGDTHLARRWRVRNRTKDLDQIDEDIKEENAEKLLNQEVDLDLPGSAQHYCIHCARYFIDEQALKDHFKTKVHKRRLKALELEPYSVEESERAAGFGNFKLPSKRKIVTQNSDKTEVDQDGDAIVEDISPNKKKKVDKNATNGAKATETFVYVTPHVEFDEKLKYKDRILEQLKRRKCKFELEKAENLWSVYEELKLRKSEFDKKKEGLSRELGKFIKSDPDGEETKKYKVQIGLIKDNLRKLKEPLWSAEEAAIVEVLKFPNDLHSLTPDNEYKILYSHLTPPTGKKDHLIIGRELGLLNFKKNENYYLKGDAAIFELGAKFYFSKVLKENNFVQFSNPDFVKSVIVEGCGEDHTNPDATFILHHNEDTKVNADNRLHLTGGASLCSFMAYHAKNVLYPKVFPLKYFTMGRQYVPAPTDEDNLFHVSQSSVIQMFGATKTSAELDELLDHLMDILKDTYSQLGYHFRLSFVPADKLLMWESLRVVVEMYSTSLNKYIDVASISVSGDFISKRLMFTYVDKKETFFPHIISGTVMNVPKLLGCVLEQDKDFSLPEMFKVEKWNL